MSLRLGDVAPNFSASTTEGQIDFHQWLGNAWGILFSHPADFTPVCTTELGAVAKIKSEFEKRNVKVIAVSVDPLASHHGWIKDINETQACTMNFPVIATLVTSFKSARELSVNPGLWINQPTLENYARALEVTDRLVAAVAARADDPVASARRLPADAATTRTLVLRQVGDRWLMARVSVSRSAAGR